MLNASLDDRYPNIARFQTLSTIISCITAGVWFFVVAAALSFELPGLLKVLTIVIVTAVVAMLWIVQFAVSEVFLAIAKIEINTEATSQGVDNICKQLLASARSIPDLQEAVDSAGSRQSDPVDVQPSIHSDKVHTPSKHSDPEVDNKRPLHPALSPQFFKRIETKLQGPFGTEEDVTRSNSDQDWARAIISRAGYEISSSKSDGVETYMLKQNDGKAPISVIGIAALVKFARELCL